MGLGELREELITRQGFFGPVATIYREHGPNEILRIEGTLNPRRLADTYRAEPSDLTDPRGVPEILLSNEDVSVAVSRRSAPMPCAYRNTDGDLLYFVHQGTGVFLTEYGRLKYEPGDYVLIPKTITFAIRPDPGPSHMLVVEARAPLGLTEHKQVGRHMTVDPTVLALPELRAEDWTAREKWELRIKHGGAHSSIFFLPQQSAGLGGVEGRPVPLQAEHPRHHSDQFGSHPCRALGLVHVRGGGVRGDHLRSTDRGGRSERRGAAVESPQCRQ